MPVKAKTAARRPVSTIRPGVIDRQRQNYMATIQQARALGAGQHALLEKASEPANSPLGACKLGLTCHDPQDSGLALAGGAE